MGTVVTVCVRKHCFQHNNTADVHCLVVAMICNDKLICPLSRMFATT